MASRRFARKPPANLCAQLGAEDGIDPRYASHETSAKTGNRKALQLCRQVERTLSLAFEGDLLRDLTIQSVSPAPDSMHLLVTAAFHGPEWIAIAEVQAALETARSRLRREIAAGIHRRKTPELSFNLVRG